MYGYYLKMNTPIKKQKPIMDKFGNICMSRPNDDPYDSPGNIGIIDGSPISAPRKKTKLVHNSPINLVIIDPNITPLVVNAQP